jgi:hypothetical protein
MVLYDNTLLFKAQATNKSDLCYCFSLYPVRNPEQRITRKVVGQLLVQILAIYYILQVLSYFKCSIN